MERHQSSEEGSSNEAKEKSPGRPEDWRVRFGIGSWDFGIKGSELFPMSQEHYVAELTQGLEAIDSISNLEIDLFDPDESHSIDKDRLVEVDGGLAAMGLGLLHQIKFDLRVPFRRQDELGSPYTSAQTLTESFRVHVRYPFHS